MENRVFIGVGHGGCDAGAYANGLAEKSINLTMALACDEVLKAHGIKTKMSRYKDENDDLMEEINECNAFNPTLAVDVHNNAGGGDGAEAFCSVKGGLDRTLARNVLNEIIAIGQNSRGVKTKELTTGVDYFGFIREVKAPSIIVEGAFLDNKADVQAIDTVAEQKAFGVAIAKGILKTLGIPYNSNAKQPTETKKETHDPNRSTGALFTCTGLWTQKNGGTWYPSSKLLYGKGDYTIGKVHKGSEHPYEALVNGAIIGFANDKCIDDEPTLPSGLSSSNSTVNSTPKTLKVGMKATPITRKSYEGVTCIAEVTQKKWTVIDIKGNRVVLGDGLNTAFHIDNLKW